jgi:hypothetical protein
MSVKKMLSETIRSWESDKTPAVPARAVLSFQSQCSTVKSICLVEKAR